MNRSAFRSLLAVAALAGILGLALAACDAVGVDAADPAVSDAAVSDAAADASGGVRGAVFSMSNAPDGNEIAAFNRAPDGTLTLFGRFATGGTGSGSFEDTANGLILAGAMGESSPNNLFSGAPALIATNAGSNSISVFRVRSAPDSLELVQVFDSGGEKPVSVTTHGRLLYVLHSGEFDDALSEANCTTGNAPSITGFRLTNGMFVPIPGSTRSLSGDPFSGCAQVSFNRAGDVLVVTERLALADGNGDEGVIVTFRVNANGTLSSKQVTDATGEGPFGFTFRRDGLLLTTEQFDGPDGPGEGAAASYEVAGDGSLIPRSGSVNNGGTDTCWFVATDSGMLGFTSSFFNPTPRISSYRIEANGGLTLIDGDAAVTPEGAADLALSRGSRYLYNINAFLGTIAAYRIGSDGSLTLIQTIEAHAPSPMMAARLGLAAI